MPPMAMTESGTDRAASGASIPGARRARVVEHREGDGVGQTEALGDPHRADVETEPVLDCGAASERELRAAPAGVEHDEALVAAWLPCGRGDVREAALLFAADDLDRPPATSSKRIVERGTVRGAAQPRGTDDHDRVGALRTRLVVQRADHRDRPLDRLGRQHTRRVEPFAEPCDLGAIGTAAVVPSGRRSPTKNLTEFVPTSMTAFRSTPNPTSVFRPRATLTFGRPARPSRSIVVAHERRIRRFDRDRADAPGPGRDFGSLDHAPVDDVARSAVCAPEGPAGPDSSRPIVAELLEGVRRAGERRRDDAQRFQHHRDLFR